MGLLNVTSFAPACGAKLVRVWGNLIRAWSLEGNGPSSIALYRFEGSIIPVVYAE